MVLKPNIVSNIKSKPNDHQVFTEERKSHCKEDGEHLMLVLLFLPFPLSLLLSFLLLPFLILFQHGDGDFISLDLKFNLNLNLKLLRVVFAIRLLLATTVTLFQT